MKKKLTILLSLVVASSGCDALRSTVPGDAAQAIDVFACAANDERLSVVFTDYERAEAHIVAMVDGLRDGDPDAVRDSADLWARVLECAKPKD